MSRDDLERQILDLWVQSRIPLTRANIQYATGVRRLDLDRWLDQLTMEGALELDLSSANEIEYKVPGAERPLAGASTFEELEKKRGGKAKTARTKATTAPPGDADVLVGHAMSLAKTAGRALKQPTEPGKKNLLASAGLSLFGPLGWLYAGDFREAIPATILFLLVAKIMPSFLLLPMLLVALPLSAVAGLVYAWQHNREGQRMPIFLADPEDKKKLKDPKDD